LLKFDFYYFQLRDVAHFLSNFGLGALSDFGRKVKSKDEKKRSEKIRPPVTTCRRPNYECEQFSIVCTFVSMRYQRQTATDAVKFRRLTASNFHGQSRRRQHFSAPPTAVAFNVLFFGALTEFFMYYTIFYKILSAKMEN